MKTDYEPGDFPVPVGTIVDYFGSRTHGRYEIVKRVDPSTNPAVGSDDNINDLYPDGSAYHLWPEGTPKKFGLRHLSVLFVRRTSFRVVVSE